MKRTFKIAAIMLALGSATAAYAEIDTATLIAELTAQGFTVTEVKTGTTTVKIEAINGTQKIERTYDAVTGVLLFEETNDRAQPGTGTGTEGTGTGTGDDDGEGDDDDDGDDDEGDDDESDNDDDEGDDDESDDDEGDDDGDDDEGDDDQN